MRCKFVRLIYPKPEQHSPDGYMVAVYKPVEKVLDLNKLREYYRQEKVIITIHAQERLRQRGIKAKDVRNCVMTGEIIEQYPDDFPFPSCLIFGKTINGKILHVVASDEGTGSRIITAYFPDNIKFEDDLKTRREQGR